MFVSFRGVTALVFFVAGVFSSGANRSSQGFLFDAA